MHPFVRYLIVLFIIFNKIMAGNTGHIAGVVKSVDTGQGLEKVLIKISELDSTTFSDKNGQFQFLNVPAGTYSLVFMAPGYGRTIMLNVFVGEGQTWFDQIFLKKTDQKEDKFYIGGIEVSAEKELLPETISTTTRISSGEIEHIQASSLGDILELIPGQEFTNPGMENVKQIKIRQTNTNEAADQNATFGTQIMVDDVPISNNANLQMDTGLNDGATYRITINSGIDLRRIAADNIKSIQVVRGIPSARYGDLTAGAILVETKSGYMPFRFKYKSNPRNHEANLSGGFGWTNQALNFNINYAKSLRDIRVDGDYFTRLGAQLNFNAFFLNKKVEWNNRIYYTRIIDEQELREGDITETERSNRSYEARFSTKLTYDFSDKGQFYFLFSADLNRQNSYLKRIVSRDLSIISTRMVPGVQEGIFVSSYISKLWVKGKAWNIYSDLNLKDQFFIGKLLNEWNVGLTARYEFNHGPGREFDPRYPPRSDPNEGDRPRSYEDIPGLTQVALFAQDEITGHLWRDFSLQLGLRLDLFGFKGFNLSASKPFIKSDFGTYLDPRINFVYYISPNNQFRLGYGRTAKSPALSMLYPNPIYFDVIDSVYFDPNDQQNRLAIVNTHIYDRTNTEIKAATRDKFEISFDQKFALIGFTLTGFYERAYNGFDYGGYQAVGLPRYYYPNWPDIYPNAPKDTLVLNYRSYINAVESESKGIEFSLFTKKLPWLSSILRIDATYHFTDSWWQDNRFEYAATQRNDPNLKEKVIPFWNPISSKSDKLIIHYRLDTAIKRLGLWFTLMIQQVAMDRNTLTGLEDSLAVGFINQSGERIIIPQEERANPEYAAMRRTYEDYMFITESKPNLWLVNLRVSKELWPGSELSFFVNNMLNQRPLYLRQRVPSGSVSYQIRNPEIFYGIEFSMVMDDFIKYVKKF